MIKNSRLTMALVVFSGLLLAGCGLLPTTKSENKTTVANKKEKTSLGDLIKGGNNQECRYSIAESNTEALMLVSGKKFYQEVIMGKEKPVTNYAISDGEWVYSWSGEAKTGIKMNLAEIEKADAEVVPTTGQIESQKLDLNNEMEAECKAWKVDGGKFKVPSDIVFQDLSTLFPKTTEGVTGNKEMCKYCEMSANPAAKADCLKNLGCE